MNWPQFRTIFLVWRQMNVCIIRSSNDAEKIQAHTVHNVKTTKTTKNKLSQWKLVHITRWSQNHWTFCVINCIWFNGLAKSNGFVDQTLNLFSDLIAMANAVIMCEFFNLWWIHTYSTIKHLHFWYWIFSIIPGILKLKMEFYGENLFEKFIEFYMPTSCMA